MLRGSADRLHRSRPSCQLIQGVINTNPAKGAPGSHRKALSPCNQSSINLPSPCVQRPSPVAGAPHSGCLSLGAGPAGLPRPPFLLGPAPGAAPARLPPLSLALSCTRLAGRGVTGSPAQPWPAPRGALSPPCVSPHSCPRGGNPRFTAEALRPGLQKPPALGTAASDGVGFASTTCPGSPRLGKSVCPAACAPRNPASKYVCLYPQSPQT